jgi:hypothetical protein
MKTNFLKTLLIALLPICAVSCIDNIPEEEVLPRDAVSFDYYIDQTTDKYYLDFYVGSDITFVNTSPESTQGEVKWDFGEHAVINQDKCQGTDIMSCYFTKAGTYNVKLTIGDYSKTQVVMIAAIKPIVTYELTEEECEVRKTLVSFKVDLPNPKNLPASFTWKFPKDTKDSLGVDVDTIMNFDATFTFDADSSVVMDIPLPSTATVFPPASIAPHAHTPSIPLAIPLTIHTPAADSS